MHIVNLNYIFGAMGYYFSSAPQPLILELRCMEQSQCSTALPLAEGEDERLILTKWWLLELLPGPLTLLAKADNREGREECTQAAGRYHSHLRVDRDCGAHREGNNKIIDYNDFIQVTYPLQASVSPSTKWDNSCPNHLSNDVWNRPDSWCVLFTH